MRKTIFAILTVAALVAVAAPVNAHPLEVPVGDDTYYVDPHPAHVDPFHETHVWKETNGVEGLQKFPTEDGNGRTIPADECLTC